MTLTLTLSAMLSALLMQGGREREVAPRSALPG